MKRYIIFVLFFLISIFVTTTVDARQWCCSLHGWVSYCWNNWYYICRDWSRSPSCTCWWWISLSYSYLNSYSNSNSQQVYISSLQPKNTYKKYVDKNAECRKSYWEYSYDNNWKCFLIFSVLSWHLLHSNLHRSK